MENAAMLWPGGKDCSLALYEARRVGYEVRPIRIRSHSKGNKDLLAYMKIQGLELAPP